MIFYLTLDCPRCGEDEIRHGPLVTDEETEEGVPLVPLATAQHFRAECEECGARMYVGEHDMTTEGVDA